MVDAIKNLNYETLCDYLNKTGLHNLRDGFIVNVETKWSKKKMSFLLRVDVFLV